MNPDVLVRNGLSKIIKISQNVVEFSEPLNASSITVDQIADILGDKEKVPVIEVATQREKGRFTMKDWRNYFNKNPADRDLILNVISLEFSDTKLARYAHVPKMIRAIDWIENTWPKDLRTNGEFPGVQQYLLMSAAGSYTNFHIDFGGSSAWYNIIKGEKIFILVPPTDINLKKFKKWHLLPPDESSFFPDLVDSTLQCVVSSGQSIVIPSGWIHAVYTPKDTIAFGGNFLHKYNFEMQLKIHGIEENLQDPLKYRFPYFEELMWYVANHYTEYLRDTTKRRDITTWEELGLNELANWLKFYKKKRPTSRVRVAQYIIDFLNCYNNNLALPNESKYVDYVDREEDEGDDGKNDCICGGKAEDDMWIGCSSCGRWYHVSCVGLSKEKVDGLGDYFCPLCLSKPVSSSPPTSSSSAGLKQSSGGTGKRKATDMSIDTRRIKKVKSS